MLGICALKMTSNNYQNSFRFLKDDNLQGRHSTLSALTKQMKTPPYNHRPPVWVDVYGKSNLSN